MPSKGEVVFSLDCEMITGMFDGKRKQLAGRVVLMKSDKTYGYVKVLDTYIKYRRDIIVSYNTKWSHIEPWMIGEGLPRRHVVSFLLTAIRGRKLVTFSGMNDLNALGLDLDTLVNKHKVQYLDLQDYFKRSENGLPYGLGPLVDYFGYKWNGFQVIINHNCEQDAFYTLRLYLDYYYPNEPFLPTDHILNKEEYKTKYHLL
jgi:hypothetical protein